MRGTRAPAARCLCRQKRSCPSTGKVSSQPDTRRESSSSYKELLESALITDVSCRFIVNRDSQQPQILCLCSTTQEILKRSMTVTLITHCVCK